MEKNSKNIDLTVRVHLEENEQHVLPEKLPKTAVHAFDENGEYLSTAEFKRGDGKTIEAKLDLPESVEKKNIRLALGPRAQDIYDDVPRWLRAMLDDSDVAQDTSDEDALLVRTARTEIRSKPSLASLVRQGAREKRLRITKDMDAYEVALNPGDWVAWLTCECEVRGRLIRRVPLPDGTSKDVGICHACILIYEVDSFPKLVARLPDRDILRLRDDLYRLKERFERPPLEWPPEYEPPMPPDPLPFDGSMGMRALRRTDGIRYINPQPEPPGLPAAMGARVMPMTNAGQGGLDTILAAGSATEIRSALVAHADMVAVYACYSPWLYSWYTKDLIKCVCTEEDGRFSTTINYTCAGDKPDLYFKALQCIGGSLHTLYDPGVVCHTHWNYACGTDVVLETTDPAARVCAPSDPVEPPPGTTPWVMPFGIGGIRLDRIDDSSGLTTYSHPVSSMSSITIEDAPFGDVLGFRHGYSNALPKPGMTHYRWQFQKDGTSDWTEFAEPLAAAVYRHFVDEDETDPTAPPTFPAYLLGPHAIGGKHLYEFRPDEPPQITDHNRYWPTDNWFNEIYSGILRSQDLSDGLYKFRLQIFDNSGNKVTPSAATFRFIVPIGVASDGLTIMTRNAYASEIDDDGFVFNVHIDNRVCHADIDGPTAGGSVADDICGFLRYGPSDQIRIGFESTHPANFAFFHFWMRRGTQLVSNVQADVDVASVASTQGVPHSYTGDGFGNFEKSNFTPTQLLDSCAEGAFAAILRTRAKATNGWSRLHIYDAGFDRAFALAPKAP